MDGKRIERNLKELFNGFCDVKIIGNELQQITALTLDSRKVVPGALFIAIKGQKENGFYYIEEAITRGAVAILVDQAYEGDGRATVVQVKDVRLAIGYIARRFFDLPDEKLKLMGVTGTNGKTTVTTLSQFLLNEIEEPVGLLGTIHYDLGQCTLPSSKTTPESVDLQSMLDQMVRKGCKNAIMEVSSHGIALNRVQNVPFEKVVFLNLTRDHLDFHGDMENYFKEKVKLFDGTLGRLPKVAIVNIDDAYGRHLVDCITSEVKIITFGVSPDAIVRANNVILTQQGLSFELIWPEGKIIIYSGLLGSFNVSNILACLSMAWAHGKKMEELALKLKGFKGVRGRMEKVIAGQNFSVIVDYAHTGDALLNALKILRQITKGRLLVVFGCGGDRDRGRRWSMTKVAQEWADLSWATSDNPRSEDIESIFQDMGKGVIFPEKIFFIPERRRAIEKAIEEAQEGDCILIAGKGHEAYQAIGKRVIPFDDCQVAKELLIFKNKINVTI